MTTTASPSRLKELKTLLAERVAEANRISETFKIEDGDKVVVSTEQHKAFTTAVRESNDIRELLQAEADREGLNAYLDAPESKSYAGMDAANAALRGQGPRSLSEAFLNSEAYKEMKGSNWRRLNEVASFEQSLTAFDHVERKDVFTASGGTHTTPAFGHGQDVGLTERMRRPGRVRDLFPYETTTANILHGLRQTGFVNNARIVPEREQPDGSPALGNDTDVFGKAPRSRFQWTAYTAPIATIMHVEYIHKNVLDDEPRLQGIIDRDMVDGVKMREDEEILYGPGGEHLTGLWNTPGAQSYAGMSGEKKSTQLRRAATRSILAWFEPNGVVCHPYDWEAMELETDDNGQYTIAVSVAVGGEKKVWRMRVVDTSAIQQGTYLVASFGYGVKLYDRQSVAVSISTETGDLWERNAVAIKGEERVGMVCDRPESLVLGSFAA